MPCNSDYLEPHSDEIERQRAAILLAWVYEQLGQQVPEWVKSEAKNMYSRDDRQIPALCAVLTSLAPETREHLIYNAHHWVARDLADWWERHQAADAEREAEERHARERAELVRQAFGKLTPEERAAVKLGYDGRGDR